MSDEMSIQSYLESGGKLTAPGNVPPRYRAELMRLMASFVDSELAGAAGFADMINQGPGIKERIAAARIVLEKTDHADRVLRLMGEFGADVARYANSHPWAARLERDADIGATRARGDMRLAVFNYPLTDWGDAVMMNLLMGRAVSRQIESFAHLSYAPLADVFREIAPREAHHAELAREGLERLLQTGADRAALQRSCDYWWPRVAISFGNPDSPRAAQLQAWGLRHPGSGRLAGEWQADMRAELAELGLAAPQ